MTRSLADARWARAAAGLALAGVLAAAPAVAQTNGEEPAEIFAIRGGADLGFGALERRDYALLNLTGLVRIWNVRLDFWVPLRFFTSPNFDFASQDWDDAGDFARLGRCIRLDLGDYSAPADEYDASCDTFGWAGHGLHDRVYGSIRVEPLMGVTLGHGSLMFNYRNSRDFERPQLGIDSEVILRDWGSARFLIDDVTNPNVVAGRIEMRPPQILLGENWDETPDDFTIGFTTVTDFGAPLYRQTAFGRPTVDEAGNARFTRDILSAISADVQYMYLWGLSAAEQAENAPEAGLLVFGDYVGFPEVADSHALHAGARFIYQHIGWDLRIGAEYRFTGNRYMPEYFDVEYVSRAQQFALLPEIRAIPGLDPSITKYEFLLSLPGGFAHGFQAYAQLVIPVPTDGAGGYSPLPIGLFVEDATGPANAGVSIWVGPFQMDQLIVGAQYQRRGFNDLDQMFNPDGMLLRVLGRLYFGSSNAAPGSTDEILQHIHLDLRFDRRYFQNVQGELTDTNDFALTVGFSGGT